MLIKMCIIFYNNVVDNTYNKFGNVVELNIKFKKEIQEKYK